MSKNESLDIRAMMNGYKVEYSYRERRPTATSDSDYEYMNDQYMFNTWDEVVEFVKNKQLEVPPANI